MAYDCMQSIRYTSTHYDQNIDYRRSTICICIEIAGFVYTFNEHYPLSIIDELPGDVDY